MNTITSNENLVLSTDTNKAAPLKLDKIAIMTCEGELQHWSMAAVLEEINRDRSSGWTDYDESDWQEGWSEWVACDEFYRLA